MGNEVSFQISGDASSAERAWAKILTEQGKLIASLAKSVEKSKELGQSMTSEAKAASMEMAQLERASVAVFERSRTPLERYNKAMDELRKMREIGLIDTQTYQREMANQNKILDAATGKTAQLEAAQAELAKRQKEAATLTESLRTPLERARDAVAALKVQFERGEISAETFRRALAKEKQTLADATGATERLKEAERARVALEREGISVTDRYRTAEEKRNLELQRLNRLLKEGAINQETYKRAVSDLNPPTVESGSALGEMAVKAGAAIVAMTSFSSVISGAIQSQEQLRLETERTNRELDIQARRFAVLEGMKEQDLPEVKRKILNLAIENAVPQENVREVATTLSSLGFANPLDGGAVDVALKAGAAGGMEYSQLPSFAEGAGAFLQAFGMKRDSEGLLELSQRFSALGNATPVQMADVAEFAKAAPAFAAAGVSLPDTMSVMASVRQIYTQPAEAATASRNIPLILSTIGNRKTDSEALQKYFGLNADQVDLKGENIVDVLATMGNRLKTMDGEESQLRAIESVFGKENSSGAQVALMAAAAGDMKKYNAIQQDTGAFERGVNFNQSGPEAARVRGLGIQQLERLKIEDSVNKRTMANEELIRRNEEASIEAMGYLSSENPLERFGGATLYASNYLAGMFRSAAVGSGAIRPQDLVEADNRNTERVATDLSKTSFDYEAFSKAVKKGVEEANQQKPQKVEVVNQPQRPVAPPGKPPSSGQGAR